MLVHVQILYKSGGASSSCFGPAKSAVAGISQTSLMFFSLKMLSCPHAVTKWLVAACHSTFMGELSPSLYRPICTVSPCRNITKYWRRQMSPPAKISLIFAKFRQSTSLLTGVLSKIDKSKKRSPSLSKISFLLSISMERLSQRFSVLAEDCLKWGGGAGGGEERGGDAQASLSHQDEEEPRANTLHICSGTQNHPL